MSTSLGSNTYNRQNWEDAVSAATGGDRGGQGGTGTGSFGQPGVGLGAWGRPEAGVWG